MTNDAGTTQDLGEPEELDPRVSTPDDGFPSFDEEDSEEVQAELDSDPDAYDEAEADYEGEH